MHKHGKSQPFCYFNNQKHVTKCKTYCWMNRNNPSSSRASGGKKFTRVFCLLVHEPISTMVSSCFVDFWKPMSMDRLTSCRVLTVHAQIIWQIRNHYRGPKPNAEIFFFCNIKKIALYIPMTWILIKTVMWIQQTRICILVVLQMLFCVKIRFYCVHVCFVHKI